MKNLPLIVGIALPIVFVLLIIGVLYVPSLFITPKHDFVYTNVEGYHAYGPYKNTYTIIDGKITAEPVEPQEGYVYLSDYPPLYYYDVEEETVQEISYDEAQELDIERGPSSEDGYTVEYRYGNGGPFLFGGGSNGGYFITKGGAGKRIPGVGSDRWSGNFELIGWVNN